MSHTLTALRHKPIGYWPLDSNLNDVSGYGRNATSTSAPAKHISLAYGAQYSSVFNRDNVVSFSAPGIYEPGTENKPFSLSAWINPTKWTEGYTAQTYRENLVLNPRGVGSTNVIGIGATGGPITYVADNAMPSGGYNRRAWSGMASSMGFGYMTNVVQPGLYGWSYWVRTNASSFNVYNGEGSAVESGENLNVTTSPPFASGLWTQFSGYFSVTTAGVIKLGGFVGASDSSHYVDISAPVLTKILSPSDPVVYFDGTLAGYEWSGPANASVSRARSEIAYVNFGTGRNSYSAQHGTITMESSPTLYGSTVSATRTQAGTGDNRLANVGVHFPLSGKKKVYGEVWVYSPTAKVFFLELMVAINNLGFFNYPASPWINVPANQWTRIPFEYIVGPTALKVGSMQIVQPGGTANGEKMFASGWYLGDEPSPIGYFDGGSVGASWVNQVDYTPSLMYVSDGPQQVLSSSGYDGITIDGTVVAFTVKSGGSEYRVEHDLITRRKAHVVGVYNVRNILLYVNGELVAQQEIGDVNGPIAFNSTNNIFYSAGSSNGSSLAVNGVGIFDTPLSGTQVRDIYDAGHKDFTNFTPNAYGGEVISLAQNPNNIFADRTWSEDSDWRGGYLNNISVDAGALVPVSSDSNWSEGTWIDSFNMNTSGLTSIFAIVPNWEGESVKVEASLDGINWTTLTRARRADNIPAGFDPTNKVLLVRVSFTDQAGYLESLTLTGLSSKTFTTATGRTVTIPDAATPLYDFEPNDLHGDWGVVSPAGSIVISGSVDSSPVETVEIWYKPNSGSLGRSFSSTSTKTNGQSFYEPAKNEWTVMHFNTNSLVGNLSIYGNIQVGRIVLYPTTLNATQVREVYEAYAGANKIAARDISVVGMTQSGEAATIYGYDWTIITSG